MKKYNTIVFILRAQPVHNAHIEIIKKASRMADKVIAIVGSSRQPRTYKNPFSADERATMIRSSIPELDNVYLASNTDSIYNDQAWCIRIQEIVSKYSGNNIGIIGHEKDSSSWYLKMFPQWDRIEVDNIVEPLDATSIRDLYFRKDFNPKFISNVVPPSVLEYLMEFKETPAYTQIIKEKEFIAVYKKQFESIPYPPIFVTSDAIVVKSGHVLLIERKSFPGAGLWALPGGFVNANTDKSVLDAMLRELKEETKIKVPVPVLKGNIKADKVFDAISRSTRGRTITHAFYIELPDGELPKIKGSDDAISAKWIPIGELDSSKMYEDHFEIISYFIGA